MHLAPQIACLVAIWVIGFSTGRRVERIIEKRRWLR